MGLFQKSINQMAIITRRKSAEKSLCLKPRGAGRENTTLAFPIQPYLRGSTLRIGADH